MQVVSSFRDFEIDYYSVYNLSVSVQNLYNLSVSSIDMIGRLVPPFKEFFFHEGVTPVSSHKCTNSLQGLYFLFSLCGQQTVIISASTC